MKKTFLVSILVINTLITFGQYKSVTKVKLFMVKWDARYTITRDIDNIRKQYLYSFTMVDGSLVDLFSDYADCKIKLNSQDTINYKYNYCNICAEIFFRRKKVIIYFLDSGDYYFNKNWHKINYGLYYALFSCFSDEIIPAETLNKAKLNYTGPLWKSN